MADTTSFPCFNSETPLMSFGELHLVTDWSMHVNLNGSTLGPKGFARNDTPQKTVSVITLNDDVLLVIFDFCRLVDEEKNGSDDFRFGAESTSNNQCQWNLEGNWDRRRWWYNCWWHKLTQVCQKWRTLILASPSRLRLHIVCTKDTPVAEILAHFRHLPLIVVYKFEEGESPRDEQNILLSLQHRHRVRSIHLSAATSALQKMVTTLNEEFPLLVSLAIIPVDGHIPSRVRVTLHKSLRAPNLRHLFLENVDIPTGAPTLITSTHLTILVLNLSPTSTRLTPEYLVNLLELMPQLLKLSVSFRSRLPSLGMETHSLVPEAQQKIVTLRSLERLHLLGSSSFVEGLLALINPPFLEQLYIYLFYRRSFGTLPTISRFLDTTIAFNGRFRITVMNFHRYSITIEMGDTRPMISDKFPFRIYVKRNWWQHASPSGWQIALASQMCSAIAPVFSVTEELILGDHSHGVSLEESNDNRVNWHNALRQFGSVKTLMVSGGLVDELSLHLQPNGADDALLGLLPRLERIVVPKDVGDAFSAFIDSRRFAGQSIYLFHDVVPACE